MPQPDDILLTDQVAIVTGGAAGIGAGISEAFARFGADVVIADIDIESAEKTAQKVHDNGREALIANCDVRDLEQVERMVQETKERFGRIDILVNNVGGVRMRPFLEMSPGSRERHVDINLNTLMHCTAAVAPVMIEGGRGGSIINISSIEGLRGAPNMVVYSASKWAMKGFTEGMALELGRHKIRVNVIAPDICPTDGVSALAPSFDDATEIEARKKYIPLGYDAVPADIAGPCVFLASPMASYITGVCLSVDGGTMAAAGWVRTDEGGWTLWNR